MFNLKSLFCKWVPFLFSTSLCAQAAGDPAHLASYKIKTSQGQIAVWDSKPKGGKDEPAVIFLHGHLANKTFFNQQVQSPVLAKYRLIFLDLPGYGDSDPAKEPEKTYSFPGFAEVVAEVVDGLQLENIVVVGWSLGGHVALELTSKLGQLRGLFITGTPPIEISSEGLSRGFRIANPRILECFGKGNLTLEEAELLATICGYDGSKEKKFLIDAVFQSDEGAKTLYPQSIMKGVGQNQLALVRDWPSPIAVVAGTDDAGINNDYIVNEVEFRNLWQGKVHMIEGAGHAIQMEKPDEFNGLLKAFLDDIFGDAAL
jgi:pimeloyl-ACP methyl ester carboxylesterase